MSEKPSKFGIESFPGAERRIWTDEEKQRVVNLWRLIDVDDVDSEMDLGDILRQAIEEVHPGLSDEEIERMHDELFAVADDANTTAAMDNRLPFERVERILLMANEIFARRNKKLLS